MFTFAPFRSLVNDEFILLFPEDSCEVVLGIAAVPAVDELDALAPPTVLPHVVQAAVAAGAPRCVCSFLTRFTCSDFCSLKLNYVDAEQIVTSVHEKTTIQQAVCYVE